jgi:hypothetical protein
VNPADRLNLVSNMMIVCNRTYPQGAIDELR